jgi:tetratricopeptide (TPR) repeat protein
MRLLVVVSHRDVIDESLASEVSTMRRLRLERIPVHDARTLAQSVLGEASVELASRLAGESEGHPFFLVELLRWAIEHGTTAEVSTGQGLPRRIETVVQSRLLQLSASDRDIFAVAAVVGREIDADLLASIGGVSGPAIDAWVRAGLAAGLLEVRHERLRFAHDKMREAILLTVPAARRRGYHLRVGEEIERRARDPIAESAALAHHFSNAGDEVRTGRWAAVAGERAFASGANAEAIRLFSEALRASRDDDPVRRARLTRLMGVAHLRIGNYPEAQECAVSALSALGRAPRATPMRVGQMMKDVALLVSGSKRLRIRVSLQQRDEATLAYYLMGESSLFLDAPSDLLWSLLRAVSLVEDCASSTQIIVYSAAGFMAGTMLLDRVANAWHSRAIAIAERAGPPTLLAMAVHRRGACAIIRADWRRGEELLMRAKETATRGEDRRQWQETLTVLGLAASYRGDLARAVELLTEVHETAKHHGDRQATLWGGTLSALCHLWLGDRARARVLLEEAETRIDRATSVYDQINFHGTRSLLLFGAGEREAAIEEATSVVERLASMSFSAYWTFHGLAAALDTLFAAIESEGDAPSRRALARGIARGCGEARRLARFCVFARPSALLWDGRRLALEGHRRRARELLVRAEADARRYDLDRVAKSARELGARVT